MLFTSLMACTCLDTQHTTSKWGVTWYNYVVVVRRIFKCEVSSDFADSFVILCIEYSEHNLKMYRGYMYVTELLLNIVSATN